MAYPNLRSEVEGLALGGDASPVGVDGEGCGGGAVDGLPVAFEPLADFFQDVDAGLGDLALGGGSDVEQVVHTCAVAVDQQVEHFADGLPVVVVFLEGPGGFLEVALLLSLSDPHRDTY